MSELADKTVAQLRSHLTKNGVEVPQGRATKKDLLDLCATIKKRGAKAKASPKASPRAPKASPKAKVSTPKRKGATPKSKGKTPAVKQLPLSTSPTATSPTTGEAIPWPTASPRAGKSLVAPRKKEEVRVPPPSPRAGPGYASPPRRGAKAQRGFPWRRIFFLCSAAACAVLAFLMSGPRFCSAAGEEGCVPCPANGACADGLLKCEDGYIQQRLLCVRDAAVEREAAKIEQQIADSLHDDLGKWECDPGDPQQRAAAVMWSAEKVAEAAAGPASKLVLEHFADHKKLASLGLERSTGGSLVALTGTKSLACQVKEQVKAFEEVLWKLVPLVCVLLGLAGLAKWARQRAAWRAKLYDDVREIIVAGTNITTNRLEGSSQLEIRQELQGRYSQTPIGEAIVGQICDALVADKNSQIRTTSDVYRAGTMVYWHTQGKKEYEALASSAAAASPRTPVNSPRLF